MFADRDLEAIAVTRRCPPEIYPAGVLQLLADTPDAPVLYTGAFENYPHLIDAIAQRRPIKGCAAAAVVKVRDPDVPASVTPVPGLRSCKTVTGVSFTGKLKRLVIRYTAGHGYLLKPRQAAGGVGVGFARSGLHLLGSHYYLQQYIRGLPLAAVFVTDGWSVKLLGVTEQIIGDSDFGVDGFRYAGSIGPVPLSTRPRTALAHLGASLAQRCDLRGVFGVDVIMDENQDIWPVEVNPRYVASIEVIERATGIAVLGNWPVKPPDPRLVQAQQPVHGKAVLFAPTDGDAPDLYSLFEADEVADVPAAGELVKAGRPVCTVFASGSDRDTCLAGLRDRARWFYTRWPS